MFLFGVVQLWVDPTFPKTSSSPLKIGDPKRKLVFQPSIFHVQVLLLLVSAGVFVEEMNELNTIFWLMWSHSPKTSTWNLKNGWWGWETILFLLGKYHLQEKVSYVPGSKVAVWGMVILPLVRNPYNGYINPYSWVDDHPYHGKTM